MRANQKASRTVHRIMKCGTDFLFCEAFTLNSHGIHFANEPNLTVASEVQVEPNLPARDYARIPDLLMVRGGDREIMHE